jgi:hypothetical protein
MFRKFPDEKLKNHELNPKSIEWSLFKYRAGLCEMLFPEGGGIHNGFTGSSGVVVALVASVAIAWYNSLELIILILVTFEHYRGTYFWSLLITTVVGILLHLVGYLLLYFNLTLTT